MYGHLHAHAPAWRDTIEKSLGLLASWGITTDGWNQPGGPGQAWTQALRDTLALFYNYSASRVGLDWLQTKNHHWNLLDDPLSLGRGGLYSWGLNDSSSTQAELNSVLKKLADGYVS